MSHLENEPSRIPIVWKELLQLLASGRVNPVTYSQRYTLDNLAEGLKAIEERKTWGKAIVQIKEDERESVRSKL